mmetsp:Transcript_47707/g.139027  ORF Transcript_47707/g.139027 Transcript_47707/m.139027 type:complete len:210 (+) Transcript_47707:382-1011(+)
MPRTEEATAAAAALPATSGIAAPQHLSCGFCLRASTPRTAPARRMLGWRQSPGTRVPHTRCLDAPSRWPACCRKHAPTAIAPRRPGFAASADAPHSNRLRSAAPCPAARRRHACRRPNEELRAVCGAARPRAAPSAPACSAGCRLYPIGAPRRRPMRRSGPASGCKRRRPPSKRGRRPPPQASAQRPPLASATPPRGGRSQDSLVPTRS